MNSLASAQRDSRPVSFDGVDGPKWRRIHDGSGDGLYNIPAEGSIWKVCCMSSRVCDGTSNKSRLHKQCPRWMWTFPPPTATVGKRCLPCPSLPTQKVYRLLPPIKPRGFFSHRLPLSERDYSQNAVRGGEFRSSPLEGLFKHYPSAPTSPFTTTDYDPASHHVCRTYRTQARIRYRFGRGQGEAFDLALDRDLGDLWGFRNKTRSDDSSRWMGL